MKNTSSTFSLLPLIGIAGMFGLLFGYDTAVINGANQYLKLRFSLGQIQEGIAAASAILGCIPGALFAGFFSDRFGRKKTLYVCAALFLISALLASFATNFILFLTARFLGGLGIGASSMICPIYIAEMSPSKNRGKLGSLFQMGIVIGIFVTLLFNALIQGLGDQSWNTNYGWRWMFGLGAVPTFLLFALLMIVSESPRWLFQQGRKEEAQRIFLMLGEDDHIIERLETSASVEVSQQGRMRELFSGSLRMPLMIALFLAVFSQFSGINAIMYYSTKIFASSGLGIQDAFYSSVIVGFVNLTFTVAAILLVDKMGRRPLLLVGTLIQFIALSLVGMFFVYQISGIMILTLILVFIAAFAIAMGPIPWIICSEIFPTRIRGRAMSLATFALWTACYIVAQMFPLLNDSPSIGPGKTFAIFAGCSLLSFLFVLKFVPETKGKSLEDIEAHWKNDEVSNG